MGYRLKAGGIGLVVGLLIIAGYLVFYLWQPWLSPHERCIRDDLRRLPAGATYAEGPCWDPEGYYSDE